MNSRVVISILSAGISLVLMTACGVDNNRLDEQQNVNYTPVRYEEQNNNDGLNNGRGNINQNGNNINTGTDINGNNRNFFDNDNDGNNLNLERNNNGIPGTGGSMMGQ